MSRHQFALRAIAMFLVAISWLAIGSTANAQKGGTANDRAREQQEKERQREKERAEERDRERERRKENERNQKEQQKRDSERREAAQREAAQRESAQRQAAQREASQRQAAERAREAAQRSAAERMRDEERRRDRDRDDARDRKNDAPRFQPDVVQRPKPAAVRPEKPEKPEVAEPEQLTAEQIDQLLKTLAGNDDGAALGALRRLAGAAANDTRPRVAAAIAEHLKNPVAGHQNMAAQALAIWATPAEAPLLRKYVTASDKTTRLAVIHGLGELHDAAAVEAIAARVPLTSDRAAAVKALKEIGSDAEREVVALLNHEDMWVRVAAIDVLSKVGRKVGADALQNAIDTDAEEFVRVRARTALREMGARAADDAG